MLGDVDENAGKTGIKKARVISRQKGSDYTKEWSRGAAGLFEGDDERSTVWTSVSCIRKMEVRLRFLGKLTSKARHILKA